MSTTSINFNTGIKRYALNGDENKCIEINVGDPNIIARYEKLQAELDAEMARVDNFAAMETDERTALDERLKAMLDEMFDTDISAKVFGNASCVSVLSNGDLLIEAFLNAFMPIVTKDIDKRLDSFAKNSAKKAEKYIKDSESAEQKAGDPA